MDIYERVVVGMKATHRINNESGPCGECGKPVTDGVFLTGIPDFLWGTNIYLRLHDKCTRKWIARLLSAVEDTV